MDAIFEGRTSESPYIQMVWRGCVLRDYSPLCPADANWNLLFLKQNGVMRTTLEGPTTKSVLKRSLEGAEFLVIKFHLGVYMPHLPASNFVDGDAELPESRSQSFWLQGSSWQMSGFENAEIFAERLVREGVLVCDPVVKATLQGETNDVSVRTVRRRFLHSTGLTQGTIHQIARAKRAALLLERGVSILDAVDQAGYADQPHMTRALKRFFGFTPAEYTRPNQNSGEVVRFVQDNALALV